MAYVGDILSYLLDRVQNESYLKTAQLRASVIDILRLIDYELSGQSAASVPIVVQTSVLNTTLTQGWAIKSSPTALTPSLTFELLEAQVLVGIGYWTTTKNAQRLALQVAPADVFINDNLIIVHGTSVINEAIGTSDGKPNQVFSLNETPLALNPDGSSPVVIRVASILWTSTNTFLGKDPADQVYRVRIDADGTVRIIFGSGTNGEIPANGAVVEGDYRIGGGTVGNSVGLNSLTSQVAPIAGVIQVFNPVQPSGGSDIESLITAKRQGPLSLRALDRAVTLQDFETLALAVPGGGISAAKAASLGVSPLIVTVYIAAEGSNPVPSGKWFPELESGTGLIGAVGRFLITKKAVPTILDIEPVSVVRPFIKGDVIVQPNILRTDAAREVNRNLSDFFLQEQLEFGKAIPLSRICQIIENTRGIDFVNILAFHRLPIAKFTRGNEDAFLASSITFVSIETSITADTYSIQWLNGANFVITGELNGPIVDAGGNVVEFAVATDTLVNHYPETEDLTVPDVIPQFVINITVGAPAPNNGDVWIFSVDNYLGNLAVEPHEMVVPDVDAFGIIDPTQLVLRYGGGIG